MLLKVIELSIVCFLALQNEASAYQKTELPQPLEVGMMAEIVGDAGGRPEPSFYVNFQEENDDVPLHVSVRFAKDELVLNNWANGGWQQEEVYHGVPLRNGAAVGVYYATDFTMRISAREDHFNINVNGKEYNFRYKMPKEDLGKIKFLVIAGDFIVTAVNWLWV